MQPPTRITVLSAHPLTAIQLIDIGYSTDKDWTKWKCAVSQCKTESVVDVSILLGPLYGGGGMRTCVSTNNPSMYRLCKLMPCYTGSGH